jgi:hypothetical protein
MSRRANAPRCQLADTQTRKRADARTREHVNVPTARRASGPTRQRARYAHTPTCPDTHMLTARVPTHQHVRVPTRLAPGGRVYNLMVD